VSLVGGGLVIAGGLGVLARRRRRSGLPT
jgi:LPXTG-motif cell wall-anchored protein